MARILLVFGSLFAVYATGMYAERYTVAPLGNGHFEGTPVTLPVFIVVFAVTLFVVLLVGHGLLNNDFRSKQQR